MANTNSRRFRVQEYFELALGCTQPQHWHSYRNKLETYAIPRIDVAALKTSLLADGEDLFYKGLLSLGEALSEVGEKRHSWAAVKMYYSVFYFLRASLAAKGYALIKNQSMYLVKVEQGGLPLRKASKRYRNDHLAVVNCSKDILGESDVLLTNSINDLDVYSWLMETRNSVHYRQREFLEPGYHAGFATIQEAVDRGDFPSLLDDYYNDSIPIYCFDLDHAVIAAPIKRALLSRIDLQGAGITTFSSDKLKASQYRLSSLLPPGCAVLDLFRP